MMVVLLLFSFLLFVFFHLMYRADLASLFSLRFRQESICAAANANVSDHSNFQLVEQLKNTTTQVVENLSKHMHHHLEYEACYKLCCTHLQLLEQAMNAVIFQANNLISTIYINAYSKITCDDMCVITLILLVIGMSMYFVNAFITQRLKIHNAIQTQMKTKRLQRNAREKFPFRF